jgi:hypothetical protein
MRRDEAGGDCGTGEDCLAFGDGVCVVEGLAGTSSCYHMAKDRHVIGYRHSFHHGDGTFGRSQLGRGGRWNIAILSILITWSPNFYTISFLSDSNITRSRSIVLQRPRHSPMLKHMSLRLSLINDRNRKIRNRNPQQFIPE